MRVSKLEIIGVYGDCAAVYMTELCLNYRYYRLIGSRQRKRMPLKLQMFWYVTPCRLVRMCVAVYLSTPHNFPEHWSHHHHCYENFNSRCSWLHSDLTTKCKVSNFNQSTSLNNFYSESHFGS